MIDKAQIIDSGSLNLRPPVGAACDHTDCTCEIPAEPPQQKYTEKWEFKPRQNPKWGTVTREGLIVGRGQNRKVIPPDEIWKLAALGATMEEMSDWFGINRETLKYNFSDYIAKGRAELKRRLRSAQIKTALEGNATLLIWLGKQYLGQQDQPTNNEDNQPLPWVE
jgi:hypothetical protein